MKNIKYHIMNIVSVFIFSLASAYTIVEIARFSLLNPTESDVTVKAAMFSGKQSSGEEEKNFDYYEKSILGSGFFEIAETGEVQEEEVENIPETPLDQLYLVGTITGPYAIARAVIRKGRVTPKRSRVYRRHEKGRNAEEKKKVFRLWEDVHGYKLVGIRLDKVYLKINRQVEVLRLYRKDEKKGNQGKSTAKSSDTIIKTISRSELKQKVLGNVDNGLRGLVAGPYRRGGKIVGYRLKRVKPYNILYKFGARSGDIVKRVNGYKINSTKKLMSLWESLKNESRINIDVERRSKNIQFVYRILN